MALGFVCLVATGVMKLGYSIDIGGHPLLSVGTILGLGGLQLVAVGLLGELLARTYFESQGKSPYIVGDTRNLDDDAPQPEAGRLPRYRVPVAR
jgi:hypothetical protein